MRFSVPYLGLLLIVGLLTSACHDLIGDEITPAPLGPDQEVRGWMILSDSEEDGLRVVERARDYDINHLQISHHIVHSLKHVREDERRELANTLTRAAHRAGIQEVVLWDRALHDMEYYPEEFKTGPDGTLDFDSPEFWTWFKDDYREKLDLVPDIQGLILTFIETGARAENQHSEEMTTNQEKLAAVVNAVAEVAIGEYELNVYARTFAYTHEEFDNIVGAIDLFEYPEIRLMMKETPHDFFLTHPNDFYAGQIDRPTIMEFDTGAEFNGQGLIANTWPEYVLDRWSDFLERDHIAGYVARTDRYGTTRIIDRPSEIKLLALKRYYEDRSVTIDDIYREFIAEHYGEAAYPYVRPAFENAFDIVTGVLYTLGTNTANHSKLNYDPYPSNWARHVSGKWIEPPIATVQHGVDREFHYWTDVVNHLAPVWAKRGGTQLEEVPWVVENGWLDHEERMNEEYLRYVLTQRNHSIGLTRESLQYIEQGQPHLTEEDFEDLYAYFERTLLTAELHRAASAAYFGFRTWTRGQEHQTNYVAQTTSQGLEDLLRLADEIESYPHQPAAGEWDWVGDAEMARQYYTWIVEEGWPEETRGYANPYAGRTFPLEEIAGRGGE